jgi:hypothetical protein
MKACSLNNGWRPAVSLFVLESRLPAVTFLESAASRAESGNDGLMSKSSSRAESIWECPSCLGPQELQGAHEQARSP